MPVKGHCKVTAIGLNLESLFARIGDQGIDQRGGDALAFILARNQGVVSRADIAVLGPGQPPDLGRAGDVCMIFPGAALIEADDFETFHAVLPALLELLLLDEPRLVRNPAPVMQFLSDNAASVHPAIWRAMQAADAPDAPYDGDALSARLDEAFSDLFECPCTALWVATGTAANCLALTPMVQPHGGVVCHREAHIEVDEAGAPGFYLHGAKLMLAEGEGAKLTPAAIAAVIDPIRDDVHQVQPHAISITQASEYGRAYTPDEVAAIGTFASERGLRLHMDGARFANAVAHLGCSPAEASSAGGVDALSFGFVKNGGLGAEAIVFFDQSLADVVRYRRKRAGHLQSKGRFLAAQILAMLDGNLWLENARAANAAAQEIAGSCRDRLLHPVEANEIFLRVCPEERAALRAQGFGFYDWGSDAARLVTAWNSDPAAVSKLAMAIAAL
jgi:threonine aldolase